MSDINYDRLETRYPLPQLSVYLAGPIRGLTYNDSLDWRSKVSGELYSAGIVPFSPMRHKEFLKDKKSLPYSDESNVLSSTKGIMTRDRLDVMRCDLVFANFLGADKVSIGTIIELGWADAFRKPVVIVMEEDNIHRHAMIDQIPGFIVTTLDDGIDIVKRVLLP